MYEVGCVKHIDGYVEFTNLTREKFGSHSIKIFNHQGQATHLSPTKHSSSSLAITVLRYYI
jgi:hypothetical protein